MRIQWAVGAWTADVAAVALLANAPADEIPVYLP
jgi:hypothetical protein